jgi:hypothetical protein
VALLQVAVLPGACGGDALETRADGARDIADSLVVSNPELDPATTPRWSLSDNPEWEIGDQQDGQTRLAAVSGGAILSDGRVAITSYATRDVRLYDRDGRYLRSTRGQQVRGAQLQTPMLTGTFAGDSILVMDAQSRWVFVFDDEGDLVRAFEPARDTTIALAVVLGVLGNGRLLIYEGPNYFAIETRTGVRRVPAPIHLGSPEGLIEKLVDEFPGGEVSLLVQGSRLTASNVPFSTDFFLAARGDRVAAGNSGEIDIHVYDGDANLVHVVRQAREPVPVPEGEFDREMAEALAREPDPGARRAAEERWRRMPRRSTYPAFSALRLDPQRNLWVEDYRLTGQPFSRWQVFDSRGASTAFIDVPSEVLVLDVADEALLGLVRGASGERVRLYRIDRGG